MGQVLACEPTVAFPLMLARHLRIVMGHIEVMSTAGANIETCGGTFVQMQNVGDPEAEQASMRILKNN